MVLVDYKTPTCFSAAPTGVTRRSNCVFALDVYVLDWVHAKRSCTCVDTSPNKEHFDSLLKATVKVR